jgi:hypothetical protein
MVIDHNQKVGATELLLSILILTQRWWTTSVCSLLLLAVGLAIPNLHQGRWENRFIIIFFFFYLGSCSRPIAELGQMN